MVRVCGQCGAGTEPGVDFCGQCGAFLEWDEAAQDAAAEVVTTAEAAPEPEVSEREAEEPSPGLADRLKAAVGIAQVSDRSEGCATPGGTPPSRAAEQPTVSAAPAPAEYVEPVQPAVAAPRARALAPPPHAEPIAPGDLVCGECGTGNKPERKFCRRCGHDLVDAEVAHVPWWRRLLRGRPRRGHAAGARPRVRARSRVPRRLAALVVVLGLVAVGVRLVRPHYDEWRGAVLDRVKGVEEVNPQAVTASSSRKGHPAALASDTRSNTWWAPRGDGKGAALTFRLDPAVRLVYVSIAPGVTVKDKKLLRSAGRPRSVTLVLTTRDPGTGEARTTTRTLALQNRAGQQTWHVATSDVVAVRLQVVSIYPGTDPRQGLAIGEVEFRARK